ncbi:uncharacterized PE-PGRS family protein PE_PGRS54-like [Lytechinus variegatus]|uniref:uncharacterized PE-PGRS family protein PE_PGRS54-like n=1 Tax=Lytechinus variegatus TaxID=7654 RepID=UPI001BB24760|nr:uncharacterized PE-PGRS family protein PE_PGRS54-like [Lytechinus variegatus]
MQQQEDGVSGTCRSGRRRRGAGGRWDGSGRGGAGEQGEEDLGVMEVGAEEVVGVGKGDNMQQEIHRMERKMEARELVGGVAEGAGLGVGDNIQRQRAEDMEQVGGGMGVVGEVLGEQGGEDLGVMEVGAEEVVEEVVGEEVGEGVEGEEWLAWAREVVGFRGRTPRELGFRMYVIREEVEVEEVLEEQGVVEVRREPNRFFVVRRAMVMVEWVRVDKRQQEIRRMERDGGEEARELVGGVAEGDNMQQQEDGVSGTCRSGRRQGGAGGRWDGSGRGGAGEQGEEDLGVNGGWGGGGGWNNMQQEIHRMERKKMEARELVGGVAEGAGLGVGDNIQRRELRTWNRWDGSGGGGAGGAGRGGSGGNGGWGGGGWGDNMQQVLQEMEGELEEMDGGEAEMEEAGEQEEVGGVMEGGGLGVGGEGEQGREEWDVVVPEVGAEEVVGDMGGEEVTICNIEKELWRRTRSRWEVVWEWWGRCWGSREGRIGGGGGGGRGWRGRGGGGVATWAREVVGFRGRTPRELGFRLYVIREEVEVEEVMEEQGVVEQVLEHLEGELEEMDGGEAEMEEAGEQEEVGGVMEGGGLGVGGEGEQGREEGEQGREEWDVVVPEVGAKEVVGDVGGEEVVGDGEQYATARSCGGGPEQVGGGMGVVGEVLEEQGGSGGRGGWGGGGGWGD